jgi:gluconokinase
MNRAPIVLVMGVSGSGKTTVGALLAGRLRWSYAEADDFHPPANVAKMAAGHPLDDADRQPWLQAIADWIDERRAAGEPGVVTCSALKRRYRDFLRADRPEAQVVYLQGTPELIASRLIARHGHFFKAALLDTQFADLEEPSPAEGILTVSVDGTPDEVVDRIIAELSRAGLDPGDKDQLGDKDRLGTKDRLGHKD